ncbi:MAG: TIGR00303 family protein [Myxacorys californica WJT36-NPBG1]|nr:TIGR00303 family protein [Myxacorys californica WJT36-NPBG1]
MNDFVSVYTQPTQARRWLERYAGQLPCFGCVLGFTETGLIPGISAAGATPDDRRFTAIADAEFLINGVQPNPIYPLPPLTAGASPVLISRAVIEALSIPVQIFNAGLPQPPTVPAIDLDGEPARCLSTGQAMSRNLAEHLFQQGLKWGEKLAAQYWDRYLVIGECVVGGTTTALAVLLGLEIDAIDKVNSSHPICNHAQKLNLVRQGLAASREETHPLALAAAVGDPMQIVVAGMTIAASRTCGVLLAGGTQMLSVYALTRAITTHVSLDWQPENVAIGTTRWVAEDPTGDTIGLAQAIGSVPLLATPLSFASSRFAQLRMYEQGYVKEGVGAGGLAIAAHLYANWNQQKLLSAIEELVEQRRKLEERKNQP